MGRIRHDGIEKEENRETATLTIEVIGTRTYREAANEANVNPSTLSYICRGMVKPTPEIIRRLTDEKSNPQGGVTYDEFMIKAGYQKISKEDHLEDLSFSRSGSEKGPKSKEEFVEDLKRREKINEQICNNLGSLLLQKLIESGIGVLGYKKNEMTQDLISSVSDLTYDVVTENKQLNKWHFEACFSWEGRRMFNDNPYMIFARAYRLGNLGTESKVSIVFNDPLTYEILLRFKDRLPYRGELSIILVDVDYGAVLREDYISHYYEGDCSKEVYLTQN